MIKPKRRRRQGELESIDEIIRKVFARGKFGGSAQVSKLWSQWRDIVGEDVALHCVPQKISDGKLYIKADSPIWRQQLDLLKDDIRDRIKTHSDGLEIKKIILR